MKFQMDFEITEELKEKYNDNDLKEQMFANFCTNYFNQLKDKLDFSLEKVKIIKKEKDDKNNLVGKEIEAYRIKADMVIVRVPSSRKTERKLPKVTRKLYDKENNRRKER